jgi:hybrid cluster-associated redox disulfide protein
MKKKIKKTIPGKIITKEMSVNETMAKYPEVVPVFLQYGLHCLGCPMASPETIGEAALLHKINLEKFLEDLNRTIKK